MNKNDKCDLSLMSWNILAPCWVEKEWYPSSYQLAADYQPRINLITSKICLLNCDVIMIQEAQENLIDLFKQKLNNNYFYKYASNNPTKASLSNGLLTLINKNWKYAKEAKIINGILDADNGDAIQITHIPSRNIYLVNLHLDYIDPLSQANMIKEKCDQLLGYPTNISIMAGDFNAEKDIYEQFQWIDYENVFDESIKDKIIPSYYADPGEEKDVDQSIDHIFYHPNQVKLIDHGKAFDVKGKTLEDALRFVGSDHIYIWAKFCFIQNKINENI
jgi:mRNA deadenylase 3'-5' endonuclease subunit Ccr4